MNAIKALVFSIFLFTVFCTKKKPDPTPVTTSTSTTGSTTSTNSGSSTTSGSTTSSTNTESANFNDGTTNNVATIIDATKTSSSGQITITMLKGAGIFPSAAVSIANVTGTGVYTDATSTYTNGQIKYSATDTYTTDYNTSGNASINVTEFTSNHITGSYTFKAKNIAGTVTKIVTGSFSCTYQVK